MSRPRNLRVRRQCQQEMCKKQGRRGGFCVRHGGGKRCDEPKCQRSVQLGGQGILAAKCFSHGGGRRCKIGGCGKAGVLLGSCKRHSIKLLMIKKYLIILV